jgi:hypothetical protein
MTFPTEDGQGSMSVMAFTLTEGHAPVNGLQMYWRSLGEGGEGGTPPVVVHPS